MVGEKTSDEMMFKKMEKKVLKVQTGKVIEATKYLKSKRIAKTINLIRAASVLKAERMRWKKAEYRKRKNQGKNIELGGYKEAETRSLLSEKGS